MWQQQAILQQPTTFQSFQRQAMWSGGGQPCQQLSASGGGFLAQSSAAVVAHGAFATLALHKTHGRELEADYHVADLSEMPDAKRSRRVSVAAPEESLQMVAVDAIFAGFKDEASPPEAHPCPFEGSTRQNSYPGYGFEDASGLAWLSSCDKSSPESMAD
jgi:hypothetical protein